MAIDKIKRILFTLICIVLVASAGVIAYAAWDDVTGKNTGDLTTTTGTNTILTAASADYANNTKALVPYNTVNFINGTTKETSANYLSWKLTPKLSDTTKLEPGTNKTIKILYSNLKIEIKKGATVLLSNADATKTIELDKIFTYGLSAAAPTAAAGETVVNMGTIIQPGQAAANVLTSATPYYFTIKFKGSIAAANVPYSGCTINITIDLEAKGV